MNIKRTCSYIFQIILSIFLLTALLFITLYKVVLFEANGDSLQKSDCAVVFGARVYADGKISHAAYYRILTAIDLYKKNYVNNIIVTGGKADENHPSEAEVMQNVALQHGVPIENIHREDMSRDTLQNMQFAQSIRNNIECHKAIGVSNDFHLARIKYLAYKNDIQIRTFPAENINLRKENYFILREMAGLLYYTFFDEYEK